MRNCRGKASAVKWKSRGAEEKEGGGREEEDGERKEERWVRRGEEKAKMAMSGMTEQIEEGQRGGVSVLHPQWEQRPAGCVSIPPSFIMFLLQLDVALCG